jgi:hypothetical protein
LGSVPIAVPSSSTSTISSMPPIVPGGRGHDQLT